MVFGSAELMDVPWETLIKGYRARLKRRSFGKLEGYCNDFLEYLAKEAFDEEAHSGFVDWVTRMVVSDIATEIDEAVKSEFEASGKVNLSKVKKIAKAVVAEKASESRMAGSILSVHSDRAQEDQGQIRATDCRKGQAHNRGPAGANQSPLDTGCYGYRCARWRTLG